jgi:hypothetical protein
MNPRDYQNLADRLTRVPAPPPAKCRAAISRAYYAAFNVGAEVLRKLGFPVGRGAGAHGEVRYCLLNSGNREVAGVAALLSDLHAQRNRADYQMDRRDVETRSDARSAVDRAAKIIQTLDREFSGAGSAQLHAAIQAWRHANGYA